jgi:hypothetical protein
MFTAQLCCQGARTLRHRSFAPSASLRRASSVASRSIAGKVSTASIALAEAVAPQS